MYNNKLFENSQVSCNDAPLAVSAGFCGARRTSEKAYLTNTDKSRRKGSLTPVSDSVYFQQKSLDLFYETKDLFSHDKKALRQMCAIGYYRIKRINNDNVVIYQNFNRLGASRAGFSLSSENSDEDRARFASKQLAQERALANVDVWAYFATLTFDSKKQDRNDFNRLLSRVSGWLRKYHIKYFLVPERHKKGGIHFHCLLSKEIAPLLLDLEGKALKNPNIVNSLM